MVFLQIVPGHFFRCKMSLVTQEEVSQGSSDIRAIISPPYPQFALGEVFRACPTPREREPQNKPRICPKFFLSIISLVERHNLFTISLGWWLCLFTISLVCSFLVGHVRNTSPSANWGYDEEMMALGWFGKASASWRSWQHRGRSLLRPLGGF